MTHELLDAMSGRGDPDADAVIAQHAAWSESTVPADVVLHVARHLRFAEGERSPFIQDYLDDTPDPTITADPARLALGAQFFADHALEIGSALFCGSLPAGYASPRGARVLTLTGRLTSDLVRRVGETAQMVLHVTSPDGLRVGAPGYEDARRVRLMHAAVRHFIQHDPSVPHVEHLPVPAHGWCDGWGVPLNQEDLLGGMLTFTVTVFEVLDQLRVEYVDEHLEAYLHLWCVVASLMGVEPELLPRDRAEAQAAAELIRIRQLDASRDGRQLTRALVGALEQTLAFAPARGLVPATVRWYVGPEVAAMLGIERSAWQVLLEGPVRWTSQVVHVDERHDQVVRACMRRIGGAAVRGFMDSNRAGDRPPFEIPTQLRPRLARRTDRFRIGR